MVHISGEDRDRITPDDLAALMQNCEPYDGLVIVDCRFDYEFQGGHIRGARHAQTAAAFEQIFQEDYSANAVFVFYCEFSQNRAPVGLRQFLEIARTHNATPPPAFVLDGGYERFYRAHAAFCDVINHQQVD
jgi:M-phase inducer tyrosine phosphatase